MPDPISWSHALPYYAAALVVGYLLGSIPFGLVLTRLAGLGDLRRIGSGNIGATNVLRTGRKDLAALTLLLDALKGTAAVLIGARFGPDITVIAGAGAFVGHLFPVWLGFQGGKGVATFLGILFGLAWPVGLLAGALWLGTALVFRISSLAALVAATLTAAYAWFVSSPDVFAALQAEWDWLLITRQKAELILLMTVLILLRHHANIRRLLRGEEPRIGRGRP